MNLTKGEARAPALSKWLDEMREAGILNDGHVGFATSFAADDLAAAVLEARADERRNAASAELPAEPDELRYPCAKCGKLRTCAEGGNVLTTCEGLGFNCDGTVEGMRPAMDMCDHGCKNTAFCPDHHVLTDAGKRERSKAQPKPTAPAGEAGEAGEAGGPDEDDLPPVRPVRDGMPPPRAAKSTKVERPAGEAKCCPKCGHSFTDPGDLAEMTDTGQCIDCALKQPPEAAPPSVTTENLDNFKALHMAALEAWAQLRQRDTEACAEERANLARQAGEHARAIADLKAKLDITEIERDDARREVERLQVQVRGMAFGLVEYEAAHRNFEEQDGSDASGARLEAAEQAIIRLAAKVAP